MPSSMTSAPSASSRLSASAVVARSGSPAVMYGMNATLHGAAATISNTAERRRDRVGRRGRGRASPALRFELCHAFADGQWGCGNCSC